MMKHSAAIPITALILMLCFPSLSVRGAADGLCLWFNVVLPTLAPFMICTQAIASLGGMELLMKPFFPLFCHLFGLTLPGSYILLCGLLCGYPLGARLCADFLKNNTISRKEADYLLAICNHPSPMFLMGYVRGQLPAADPALLLLCLYLPVLPLSLAARACYQFDGGKGRQDGSLEGLSGASGAARHTLEDILMSVCDTMVMIGGYIMLFSIFSSWIRQIPDMPKMLQALVTGLAEITTGVHQVSLAFPPGTALPACIAVIAFGGFSGIFQTKSVIKDTGLSIRHYVGWKILHTCLSCLILLAAAMAVHI